MKQWLIGMMLLATAAGILVAARRTSSQELPVPVTTPNAAEGLAIYEARCATCHGPEGNGDGELAAQSVNPPTAFSDPAYRQTAVPAELFNTIKNGRLTRGMPLFGSGSSNPLTDAQIWDLVALILSFATPPESIEQGEGLADAALLEARPDNTTFATQNNEMIAASLRQAGLLADSLSDMEQLAIVDFLRTASYDYFDISLLNAPIPNGQITGTVVNGTTESAVQGQEIILRAFTPDFVEAIRLTAVSNPDGRFTFNLDQVLPNYIYIASTDYNDIPFASFTAQITREDPMTDLPITVYDPTTDDADVLVENLELIIDFVEDGVRVAEIYQFSNLSSAIYTGPTGNPAEGTIQFALPAGANDILFERAFGNNNFSPTNDIIQSGNGWVDTTPLRPGRGTANILLSYVLPFEPGMTIAHPLPHFTNQATLLMPATGVTVEGNEWTLLSQETLPIGPVNSYYQPNVQQAARLNLTLNGRPQTIRDAAGNSRLVRNNQQEIVWGSLGILVAAVVGFGLIRQSTEQDRSNSTAETLLLALVALDNAYEKGELTTTQYRQQRLALKSDLRDLWREEP